MGQRKFLSDPLLWTNDKNDIDNIHNLNNWCFNYRYSLIPCNILIINIIQNYRLLKTQQFTQN